jgi:adenylate kinase family enzyme
MAPRAYPRPADAPVILGRRIMIHGVTGSGKTTLSRRLSQLLGLGVIEMDAIRHDGGWDATPWEEFRERVRALLDSCPQGWVTDGNYSRVADIPLERTDTLIWLHLPQRVTFLRVLARTIYRCRTGKPFYASDGPRETWRQSFLSRQSILLWSLTHHRHTARSIRARLDSPHNARVYEVRSSRDVEALLRAAERQAESSRV